LLSIIMLTYGEHQVDMTISAIQTIKQFTSEEYELLVWVNGDAEEGYVEPLADATEYVLGTQERISLARAYNEALEYTKGDIICVLHNDCFVEEGWARPLIEEAENGNIAFPLVRQNAEIIAARGIALVPDWMPPSCCFAIGRETLEHLGGWDEQFEFCHFEDMDLFQRATNQGIRLVQVPSTVFHIRGVTRADQGDKANAAFKANEKRYALKHGVREGQKITYPLPILEQLEPKEDPNVIFH